MVTQPGPHAARRREGAARLSTECITRKDPEHGAAELAPTRLTSWQRRSWCRETLNLLGRKREFSPSLFV
jgi:hypothetical protein